MGRPDFCSASTDKVDWKTALALTNILKKLDNKDPIKYDFALFGLGVENVM
ncbi:MAG: DUF2400 domain-containing protein [Bacteroidetes bacterium]|nr:DUF2400 domain-containing protein [Bacteroidota bacterium]